MSRKPESIDRSSPVPLYRQVKQVLAAEIRSHAGDAGYMLPGETHLCRRFGVSIATVRRAMAEFVDEGLIVRQRGKGTFVDQRHPLRPNERKRIPVVINLPWAFVPSTFEAMVLKGVEAAALESNCGIDLHVLDELTPEDSNSAMRSILDAVEGSEMGAVILLGRTTREVVESAKRTGLRVIVVDQDYSDSVDSVFAANFGGACSVMNYLAELGHQHIAFVCAEESHPPFRERLRGYRRIIKDRDLTLDDRLIRVWNAHRDCPCAEILGGLLAIKTPATAIFAADDGTASRILRTAVAMGIAVPGDLSIVGFDDFEFTRWLAPPLTTVRIDKERLGREACTLALSGGGEPRAVCVSAPLIVRASCAAPATAHATSGVSARAAQ